LQIGSIPMVDEIATEMKAIVAAFLQYKKMIE